MLIRILLVEDDPLQADYTSRILQSQRFYVEVASSGSEAIRKIISGWFDVVLIDYQIPGFDGVSAGRIIANLTRSDGRPRLIALSASPDTIRIREAGGGSVFDAIIGKPWNPSVLMAAITRCYQMLPPSTHRAEAVQPSLPVRHNSATGSTPGRTNVLVIDDDQALRAVICVALQAIGYGVDHASNGLDALKKVFATTFDVIVVDYQLPHIDGLATGRLIFDLLPRMDRPRLVALTSTPELLAGQEAGGLSIFDDVVAKQDGIKALLDAVGRCAEYQALRTRVEPPDVVHLDSILAIAIDTL